MNAKEIVRHETFTSVYQNRKVRDLNILVEKYPTHYLEVSGDMIRTINESRKLSWISSTPLRENERISTQNRLAYIIAMA